MRKVIVPLVLLFMIMAGATAASAQWRKLGQKDVDFHVDHDIFDVTYRKGDFRKLKIAVKYAPVHFSRVVVTFGNGETQELEFRDVIPAGGETRALDLEGRERIIKNVQFWYESEPVSRKKAKVTLYGRA